MTFFVRRLSGARRSLPAAAMFCVLTLAGTLLLCAPAGATGSRQASLATQIFAAHAEGAADKHTDSTSHLSGKARAAAAKDRAAKLHAAKVKAAKAHAAKLHAAKLKAAKVKAAKAHAAKAHAAKVKAAAARAVAAARAAAAKARAAAQSPAKLSPVTLAPGQAPDALTPSQRASDKQAKAAASALQKSLTGAARLAGWQWSSGDGSNLSLADKLASRLAAAQAAAKLRAEADKAARQAQKAAEKATQSLLPGRAVAVSPSATPKPSVPAPTAAAAQPVVDVQGGPVQVGASQGGTSQSGSGQGGSNQATAPASATPPAKTATQARKAQPVATRPSKPAARGPQQVVLALPKRIAQAGLSVGLGPLILLIVVGLIALCLVVVGTRRRTSDEQRPS